MTERNWESAQRNWPVMLMFTVTAALALVLVPWYGLSHGYTAAAWIWFAVILSRNELAITCGYHRLFAHATYEAHPAAQARLICFSADGASEQRALVWSAGHRIHHRLSMTRSVTLIARGAAFGSRTSVGC